MNRDIKIFFAAFAVLVLFSSEVFGQVGIGTTTPNANAMLDITSTTKGLLPPRMTTAQRTTLGAALGTPTEETGMIVYDTNYNGYYFWDGTQWVGLGSKTTGTLYFINNTISTVLGGVAEPIKGAAEFMGNSSDINELANGQLQYNGADTKMFSVSCSFTAIDFVKKKDYNFYIYKNGSVDNSMLASYSGDHGDKDTITITLTGSINMATGDYIELWAEYEDGVSAGVGSDVTSDIIVEHFNLTLTY